jgi:hypothetical protein
MWMLFRVVTDRTLRSVHCRQKFVLIAQMIFAELARSVSQRFQQFRNGRIVRTNTDVGAGHSDLG